MVSGYRTPSFRRMSRLFHENNFFSSPSAMPTRLLFQLRFQHDIDMLDIYLYVWYPICTCLTGAWRPSESSGGGTSSVRLLHSFSTGMMNEWVTAMSMTLRVYRDRLSISACISWRDELWMDINQPVPSARVDKPRRIQKRRDVHRGLKMGSMD